MIKQPTQSIWIRDNWRLWHCRTTSTCGRAARTIQPRAASCSRWSRRRRCSCRSPTDSSRHDNRRQPPIRQTGLENKTKETQRSRWRRTNCRLWWDELGSAVVDRMEFFLRSSILVDKLQPTSTSASKFLTLCVNPSLGNLTPTPTAVADPKLVWTIEKKREERADFCWSYLEEVGS